MDNYKNLKIEAILEDELYSAPPLMPVVVAKLIGTKQDITRVFKLTSSIASTAELKHLRRIRDAADNSLECIICSLSEMIGDKNSINCAERIDLSSDFNEVLTELDARFKPENILKDFRIVLVPSEAPRTEHQLKACQSLWPCKYAKCNYLIKCIEGSVFGDAELLVIKIVVNEIIRHIKSSDCLKTSGSVIFRYAQIYGVGLSCDKIVKSNPTQHSAMLAIDSVAQNAGSSHWKCHGDEETRLQNSIQALLSSNADLQDYKIDSDFLPYLCTNYDVLVTEEPCMMCTMGLVQSRIRRLFYLDLEHSSLSNDEMISFTPVCYPDKAIEKFLVHRDKSLNHRFEAWRIKLTD